MLENEKMTRSLGELIAIESVSEAGLPQKPFGEGPAEALSYVLKLCGEFGFRTKKCGDYLGYAEIGQGRELIGILVHLDVVPAGSGWDSNPFELRITDGKLFGRGVVDDKGPAIACIYAMKDLLDSDVVLAKRIRIIFGQTEETGEWTDMDYYKLTEEIPTYGFTPDADFPAIYGEKGIAMYELTMPLERAGIRTIKGGTAPNVVPDFCEATLMDRDGNEIKSQATGRASHASMPEDGENAISKLMKEIAKLHRKGTVDCPLAVFYEERIGEEVHGEKMDCRLEDAESGLLTFNVGMIETEQDQIKITVDIRYPVTSSIDDLTGRLERSTAPYGVAVSLLDHMKPVYMDRNGAVIRTLLEAYREVTGDLTEPSVMGGGTYARAMDHIVAFGPLFPGRECTEHQKNEYLFEEDFLKLREIYRLAIRRLAEWGSV